MIHISTVTRLKDLFQKWDLLDDDEKEFIDMQIEKWNSPEHKQLYKTVKQALIKWGKVQDTEGAPGCEPGYYTFSCDAQLEEELVKVLQTIESLLRRIKEVRQLKKIAMNPKNQNTNFICHSLLQKQIFLI